jgi:hypothetical protein
MLSNLNTLGEGEEWEERGGEREGGGEGGGGGREGGKDSLQLPT